jgi:hypothetical protein
MIEQPYAATIRLLERQRLASGQPLSLTLQGRSMLPLVPPGSRIRVSAVAPDAVRPGDIVVLLGPRLICHRVLACDGQQVQTRGDNCTTADRAMPLSAVLGRVEAVQRGGEWYKVDTPFWRRVGRLVARVGRSGANHPTFRYRTPAWWLWNAPAGLGTRLLMRGLVRVALWGALRRKGQKGTRDDTVLA